MIGNNTGGTHFATLGNPSFSAAFGTSLNTANVDQAAPYPTNAIEPGLSALGAVNGTGDNVDHTFDHPTTHAFSMEAMIKIGFDPATTWAQAQEIIAGEGDAGDSSDRSWQFRIEARTNAANPWVLRFQKVSGFGGVGGSTANFNLDANIPATGVDAIAQNDWYHVAVSFNGDINDASNLKLYWTKMDPSNTQASQIGVGQMNGWLRQQDTDFALGNEMRDFNGNTEPYIGSIDEVRISDIVRTPDQFLFTGGGGSNANFDSIGGVNGTDMLIWQRGLGSSGASATLANGNANADTAIDGGDLGVWRTQFGMGVTTAIPEPTTCLMLGLAACASHDVAPWTCLSSRS